MIRDDFAGPGGWDEALLQHGRDDVIGVETDGAACATARAAGHRRERADVRAMRGVQCYRGGLEGYVASPPCQSFSAAGKGAGRQALDALLEAATIVATGETPESAVASVHNGQLDERSVLALEPLCVIRQYRPQWVALEQVPPVLPLWQAYAGFMDWWGYGVAVGYLHAEQYGVPQTRKRAILMAHQDRCVSLPVPTHSKYHSRTPERLDPGVPKWVSMAEALGGNGYGTGGAAYMRSNYGTGGDPSARGERSMEEPAPTVTGKVGRNHWVMGDVRSSNGTIRSVDVPAPTVTSSMDNGNYRWQLRHGQCERDRPIDPRTGKHATYADDGTDYYMRFPVDRPAPTVTASAGKWKWEPTVTDPPRQKTPGSIQVTVREAATLQSFRPDYPWQGKKTACYQQVGNAVPPVMAMAVLDVLIGVDAQCVAA